MPAANSLKRSATSDDEASSSEPLAKRPTVLDDEDTQVECDSHAEPDSEAEYDSDEEKPCACMVEALRVAPLEYSICYVISCSNPRHVKLAQSTCRPIAPSIDHCCTCPPPKGLGSRDARKISWRSHRRDCKAAMLLQQHEGKRRFYEDLANEPSDEEDNANEDASLVADL